MRKLLLLAIGLAVSSPARGGDWADAAARPGFSAAQGVSDGVYNLLRGHLFLSLLPGGLSRRMSEVPQASSYDLFSGKMRARQEAASRRLVESRPKDALDTPAAWSSWRRRAFSEETGMLTDSFADAMVERYALERFGRDSGSYASHLQNWDPRFLACAAVLGGAYVYAAGLRADWLIGPVRVDLDTKSGAALRSALEGGDGRGLVSLSLSRRSVSLRAEAGLSRGRSAAERLSLSYTARF